MDAECAIEFHNQSCRRLRRKDESSDAKLAKPYENKMQGELKRSECGVGRTNLELGSGVPWRRMILRYIIDFQKNVSFKKSIFEKCFLSFAGCLPFGFGCAPAPSPCRALRLARVLLAGFEIYLNDRGYERKVRQRGCTKQNAAVEHV